jgi:hypothetical protein
MIAFRNNFIYIQMMLTGVYFPKWTLTSSRKGDFKTHGIMVLLARF